MRNMMKSCSDSICRLNGSIQDYRSWMQHHTGGIYRQTKVTYQVT